MKTQRKTSLSKNREVDGHSVFIGLCINLTFQHCYEDRTSLCLTLPASIALGQEQPYA